MREWWRRKGRVSLTELGLGWRLVRIIPYEGSGYAAPRGVGKKTLVVHPSIPETPMAGEDTTIPRVALAPTPWHALASMAGGLSPDELRADFDSLEDVGGRAHEWFVYGLAHEPDGFVPNREVQRYVPDAGMTGEEWALKPVRMTRLGIIGGDFGPDGHYSVWALPK